MRGFPLRAAPRTLVRVELPHVAVAVEQVPEGNYLNIEKLPHHSDHCDRDGARALGKALTALSDLLGASSAETTEACASALERAAAELRKAIT